MLTNRRKDALVAAVLVAPFLAIYLLVFVWPTIQMFGISFTDARLIGSGDWVGLDNYARLDSDPRFRTAAWNTAPIVGRVVPRIGPLLGVMPDATRDVDITDLAPLVGKGEGE